MSTVIKPASELESWTAHMKPEEFPAGVLECMDARLFTEAVFPLRELAGCAIWPSKLFDAHVRPAGGTSQHAMNPLSVATDLHTRELIKVFLYAQEIKAIGGIGLYFDTNTPMIHIDLRPVRTLWLRVDGEYIYAHADPVRFYKELAKWS